MDTSLKLPAVSAPPAAADAAQARPPRDAAPQQDERGAREAVPDVTVTISPAARAAEQAAAVSQPAPTQAAPRLEAAPLARAEATSRAASAAASPLVRNASEAVATGAPESVAPRPARGPDAASAANRPAMQLYLENATRPDNQPPASPFRTSA